MLLSGLSVSTNIADQSDALSKALTSLKESLDSGTLERFEDKTHDKPTDDTSVLYLSESDKLLVVNGAELKLVSRENDHFPLTGALNFTL
jgi:hypothetical protein